MSKRDPARSKSAKSLGNAPPEDFAGKSETLKLTDKARFLLASIVESSEDSIVTFDLDGKITSWNRAAERLYGYAAREAIGKPFMMLALPEDLAEVFAKIDTLKQNRKVKIYETLHVHQDGSPMYLEIVLSPVRDDQGKMIGASTIARDVTERKRSETALRESERRFRSVFSGNMTAMGIWTKQGKIIDANDALLKLTGYSRKELDAGEIKWNEITPSAYLHLDEQALREIAEHGVCQPFEKEYIRKDGRRVPVLIGGGNFDDVGEMGIFFAVDLTESKRAEKALRESEERMRLALQASNGATWDLDLTTGGTFWSSSHFEILGYPINEKGAATFKMWSDTIHKDDRERVLKAWDRAKSERNPYEIEYRIRHVETGEIFWVFALGQFFYNEEGEAYRSVGVVFDISGRKRTEQELATQRRLYKSITDNATTALFIMNERQQCVFMNPAAELLTGYTLEETLGRVLHDVIHHSHADGSPYPLSDCPIDRAFPTQNKIQGEETFVHKDGHFYNVVFAASPLLDENGATIGTVIEVQDITERKRAERALRESDERYGLATQAVRAVIYDWNIAEDRIIRSQELENLLGFSPDKKEVQTNAWWKSRLHPDDAKRAVRLVREKIRSNAERFEDEYRVRHRNGSYVWVSDIGILLRDKRGKAIRCVGSVTNITKRKEAEGVLERYRLISERARDIVWLLKPNGRIVEINQAAIEAYGYSRSELLEKNIADLRDLATLPMLAEHLRLANEGHIQFETVHVRKDSTTFPVEVSASGANFGGERLILGIVRDISERRKAEENVRQSEERLRLLIESAEDYAIFTMTKGGIINSWNTGAEKIFGWTETETIGHSGALIFTPEDRKKGEPEKEIQTSLRSGRAPDERFHIRKDGSRFYASGVLTTLKDTDGSTQGFVKIARDMTEQIEAGKTLRDKEMLQKLVAAQEDERRRIARDLHDELGQQLTALRLKLEKARRLCKDDKVCAEIDQIGLIAKSIDEGVDFLAWELRPAALDQFGLIPALANYVKQWMLHSGVRAELLASSLKKRRFTREVETNLYRIVQEALNNVHKHAEAASAEVMLEKRGNLIVLIIQDDGKGFNVEDKKIRGKGIGLIGMQERAELIKGTLEIESAPGEGTTIFVRVPVYAAQKGDFRGK